MLDILYTILVAMCVSYCLYFFIFSLFAFMRTKPLKETYEKVKFAVLICARNESNVIGELIDSLKSQNYDKDYYDIITVVNNCTDNTEEVALSHGSLVEKVNVPTKTKGEVLNWVRDNFKDKKYDAYIIFDADNIVDKNFLKEMSKVYSNGYMVAQGFRDCKNIKDNWITTSYALFYYIQNFFFNRARKNIGHSALINGTGFMVDKSFFEECFNAKTLTEDIEFTASCVLKNEQVYFADKAITYDEHTRKFNDSWNQRKRWSKGNIQCFFLYSLKLLKKFFNTFDISNLDLILNYSAPFIQILSLILSTILLVCSITGNSIGIFSIEFINLVYFVVGSILTYICGLIVNIFILLINNRKITELTNGILLFALFMITWIPINIHAFISKNNTWQTIKHGN